MEYDYEKSPTYIRRVAEGSLAPIPNKRKPKKHKQQKLDTPQDPLPLLPSHPDADKADKADKVDDDDDEFEDAPPPPPPPLPPPPPPIPTVVTPSPEASVSSDVTIRDRKIKFRIASSARASREGRPCAPSAATYRAAQQIIRRVQQRFEAEDRHQLVDGEPSKQRSTHFSNPVAKPTLYSSQIELQRSAQISVVKSRNLETFNQDPTYLLGDRIVPQTYDRLLESALRANAANSSVTNRSTTQGASNQTPRLNSKMLAAAAASQCVNTALVLALAEHELRTADGVCVRNALATSAVDPAALLDCEPPLLETLTTLPVLSSTELVYNTNPTKLTTVSIRSVAMEIAADEINHLGISECVCTPTHTLTRLCRVIVDGKDLATDGKIDAAWACVVLVCFLSWDPRSRPLMRVKGLTDLDFQTAVVLEAYGRAEIIRRVRLVEQQQRAAASSGMDKKKKKKKKKKRKKRKKRGEDEDDEDDEEEEEEEEEERMEDEEFNMPPLSSSFELSNLPPMPGEDAMEAEPAPVEPPPVETAQSAQSRRRLACGVTSISDSYSLIAWWLEAFETLEFSVLKTLLAVSKSQAKKASLDTLETQASDAPAVANDEMLRQMASQNAEKSVVACASLVNVPEKEIPGVVVTRIADGIAVGFERTSKAIASTALHAVDFERSVTPQSAPMIFLHSRAVCEMHARDDSTQVLPGVLERMVLMQEAAQQAPQQAPKQIKYMGNSDKFTGFRCIKQKEAMKRHISDTVKTMRTSTACGITRSVVVMKLKMATTDSVLMAGRALASEARGDVASFKSSSGASGSTSSTTTPQLVSCKRDAQRRRDAVTEPLCGAASRLAIGLKLNESLRRWLSGRSRRNDPVKTACAPIPVLETPTTVPLISDSEPLPLATITDFKLRIPKAPASNDEAAKSTVNTVNAALHVCVDGAARVVDVAKALKNPMERRALLLVAASQASYLSDVAAAISAASSNSSISNSKKITIADTSLIPLLSCYDCLVGGIASVQRLMANTPYSQACGPLVDSGVTPSGLLAHFYKSDKRQHGSLSLGQEAANELCLELAKKHYKAVGSDSFVSLPIQTRGVPHGLIPGVHTVLDTYMDALESARVATKRTDADTVDAVFCLPFSPFTQQLAPDIEASIDSTIKSAFRDPNNTACVNGRSYLADATPEDDAIFIEPLWRRPCQTSIASNPFCGSGPYCDSLMNAACAIAAMIDCGFGGDGDGDGADDPDSKLDTFHGVVTAYVLGKSCSTLGFAEAVVVTDVLWLLFSVVWPQNFEVDALVTPPEIAKLAAAQARASHMNFQNPSAQPPSQPSIKALLSTHERSVVKKLWAKFRRSDRSLNPWYAALRPLLLLILQNNGSHDVDATAPVAAWRAAVDGIAKGAFLVHSEDGKAPISIVGHPLQGVASPEGVRRPHIDPVFVAMGANLEIAPRGALVGLQPFQLRHGIVLLLAATHVDDVSYVDVVRNEGPLALRLSSAADILKRDGTERTSKAISPLQAEGDSVAFGSRESKLYSCSLQRSAWDRNARSLFPVFTEISLPRPSHLRRRGEFDGPKSRLTQIAEVMDDERAQNIHPIVERAHAHMREAAKAVGGLPEELF